MKNTILTLGLMLAFIAPWAVQAQRSVVKLKPFNLFVGNISVAYEYAVNRNQSAQLGVGITLDRTYTLSDLPFVSVFVEDVPSTSVNFSGFSIAPEYRFYLGRKDAPRGFYLGPYFRHIQITGETRDFVNSIETDFTLTFVSNAPGLQLGAQWLIKDRVSIDWSFFGVGLGLSRLRGEITAGTSSTDLNNWEESIEDGIGEVPVFGRDLSGVSLAGNTLSVSIPAITPDFRSSLTIGIAF